MLPEVHYLTQYGAQYLADHYRLPIEEFPYPKGQVQFSPTLAPHRFAQIDFHIGCRQWVENHSNAELLFTHMDFDVEGSKRHGTFTSRTELRVPNSNVPIVPDGMFGVELNGSPITMLWKFIVQPRPNGLSLRSNAIWKFWRRV